jgi:hypothetical protein
MGPCMIFISFRSIDVLLFVHSGVVIYLAILFTIGMVHIINIKDRLDFVICPFAWFLISFRSIPILLFVQS